MPDAVQLTLVLRQPEAAQNISERLLAGTWNPSEVKPEDLAANPSDVTAVLAFAQQNDLQVVKSDPAARSIRVAGSASAIASAFKIPNASVEALNYKGPITLPPPLDSIVIAVLGLDSSPIAKPATP